MQDCGHRFDVIIVGAGIMGSCTAYQVAKRGHRALLLEQFDFLHCRGSSHGESRTVRATYPEPYYHSMVMESIRLWEEAQSEIGYRVYFQAPQLDMGPEDSASLRAVVANCSLHSVPHRILDRREVGEEFSGRINLPEGWSALVTEVGGVVKPTKAVAMFQALALRSGAVLRDNEEVKHIERSKEEGGGVVVTTGSGERFWGRKCVVTAGPWTQKLVKAVTGVKLPVHPLETTIYYWRVRDGDYPMAGFPSFASYGRPYIYGSPELEYPGLVKIAVHGGEECDPDQRRWGSRVGVEGLRRWIEEVLGGRVEGSGEAAMVQSCVYSMTPDEDFVLDFLGGAFEKEVAVGGGFSGHGFKMGPLVGRILADMALEGEAKGVEMEHFRLSRFLECPKGNLKDFEDQVAFHPLPPCPH